MKKSKIFVLIISLMVFMFIPNVYAIDSINDEIANGSETITLDGDIVENVVIPNDKNITIDLNGHKISSTTGVTITNYGDLTIEGEGDVVGSDSYVILNNGPSLYIENGNYYSVEEIACNNDGTPRSGSSIVVNGWDLAGGMVKDTNSPDFAELTINGGTFTGGYSSIFNAENGVAVINAGTITNRRCVSPSDGISRSIGVYNKGQTLVIDENAVLNGYLTNDVSGVDVDRVVNIIGIDIPGINQTGETDHLVYDDIGLEGVNVTNKMEFNADSNNFVLMNVTAGEVNVTGAVDENGVYYFTNVETPRLTFGINRDLTITDTVMDLLNVSSGENLTVTGSEIATITCSSSTTCEFTDTEGTNITFSNRATGTIDSCTFTGLTSTNRSAVTVDDSTITNIYAYYRDASVEINSGNYGSVFSGRNHLGEVQGGTSLIEINNGTFTGLIHAAVKGNSDKKIIINDGVFLGDVFSEEVYPLGGQITIYGGTFNSDYHDTVSGLTYTGYEVIGNDEDSDIVIPSQRVHNVNVFHVDADTQVEYSTNSIRVASGMDYNVNDLITLGQGNLLPQGYKLKTRPSNATGTMRDNDINVIFEYDNKYTLTYESNGGTNVSPQVVEYNTVVALQDITKDGFIFGGWYSDKNLTNKVESVTVTSNVTVYAKWIKQYTVTISYVDENDEKIVDDDTQTVLEGGSYTTSAREFDGYTLASEPNNKNGSNVAGNVSVVYHYTSNNQGGNEDPGNQGGQDPVDPGNHGGEDPVDPGNQGGEDPVEPGNQGGEDPVEPGNQGGEDPVEPGNQGGEDPVEPGNQGGQDPVEPGNQGGEDPVEPGNQGGEDPVEPGNQGGEDPVETGNQGEEPTEHGDQGNTTDPEKEEEDTNKNENTNTNTNNNNNNNTNTNTKTNTNTNKKANTNVVNNTPAENSENTQTIPEVVVVPKNNDSLNIDASQKVTEVIEDIVAGNSSAIESEKVKNAIVKAVNDNKAIVVEVITKALPKEDVADEIEVISEKLEGSTAVDYYDISVVLTVDNVVVGNVSELEKSIRVTLPLPDDIPAVAENYERQYYVLRLHNGEVKKIKADLNDDNTISFDSDKFSIYTISYEDTLINNSNIGVKTTANGKGLIFLIGITLLFFILALIVMVAARRKKGE